MAASAVAVSPGALDGGLFPLQTAQAAAANGTAIDVRGLKSLTVEISGAYTNITANFEGSIDPPGTANPTWNAVGLKTGADGAAATTATTNGLYKLPADGPALAQFRVRTTIGVATGSMTARAWTHPR